MNKHLLLILLGFGLASCSSTPTTYGENSIENGKYVGQWKNGKWNGQGTFTYNDGVKYVGEFKDNYFHGEGSFTQPNGLLHRSMEIWQVSWRGNS